MGCFKLDILKKLEPKLTGLSKKPSSQKVRIVDFLTTKKGVEDYYPFGMIARFGEIDETNYRFGFQSQESDDEVKGKGNTSSYKYRMSDNRLGRFFAVDPLTSKFPFWSPYSFSGNQVISTWELEGREANYNINVSENSTLRVRNNTVTLEQLQDVALRSRHSTGNHYDNPIAGDWVQINCSNCKTATGTVLVKLPTANVIRTKTIITSREWIHIPGSPAEYDKKPINIQETNGDYYPIAPKGMGPALFFNQASSEDLYMTAAYFLYSSSVNGGKVTIGEDLRANFSAENLISVNIYFSESESDITIDLVSVKKLFKKNKNVDVLFHFNQGSGMKANQGQPTFRLSASYTEGWETILIKEEIPDTGYWKESTEEVEYSAPPIEIIENK